MNYYTLTTRSSAHKKNEKINQTVCPNKNSRRRPGIINFQPLSTDRRASVLLLHDATFRPQDLRPTRAQCNVRRTRRFGDYRKIHRAKLQQEVSQKDALWAIFGPRPSKIFVFKKGCCPLGQWDCFSENVTGPVGSWKSIAEAGLVHLVCYFH